MDSVTQAALGAAIGGAIAPKSARRKAMLAGAFLGTLPDLDVLIDFGGAVENFTYHRGFSHSLLVLAPVSVALWLALRRWWAPVQEAPWRWLALISITLLTHPLLDAHTAYGTQLLWPFEFNPAMWATLFIIDPIYTLPMLVGVAFATARPLADWSRTALRAALMVSTLYIGWSWVAQGIVRSHVDEALADKGLDEAPVFLTPTPFNTLLWRAVVMTDDGYLEGFDSLVIDEPMTFEAYDSDIQSLEAANNVWAVERLRWFSSDFVGAAVKDDHLVLADLRMGVEPNYIFTHIVAKRGNPHWEEVTTELLPVTFGDRALGELWQRIWSL
ncbi:MAG: metal-dependent hydrolase [Woeseiaceae bacterium]|nr:metal-dependent hydrolase [Woeseiaceae bacterium]